MVASDEQHCEPEAEGTIDGEGHTFHGLKISIMLMIASATSNIRLF